MEKESNTKKTDSLYFKRGSGAKGNLLKSDLVKYFSDNGQCSQGIRYLPFKGITCARLRIDSDAQ